MSSKPVTVFYCDSCGRCARKLDDDAKFCPYCGKRFRKTTSNDAVISMFLNGETPQSIAPNVGLTYAVAEQVLGKAAAQGAVPADLLLQEEYKSEICDVIHHKKSGHNPTNIKPLVPEGCSYFTIAYYAEKDRQEMEDMTESRDETAAEMMRNGMPMKDIEGETGIRSYELGRILGREIKRNRQIADFYITPKNEERILQFTCTPKFDGKMKPVKEDMPDLDYIEIRAVLMKHGYMR